MKPVEEAVKSTAPFINSTFSSKHTVELFSGKKRTKKNNHIISLQLKIIILINWVVQRSCGLDQSLIFVNK